MRLVRHVFEGLLVLFLGTLTTVLLRHELIPASRRCGRVRLSNHGRCIAGEAICEPSSAKRDRGDVAQDDGSSRGRAADVEKDRFSAWRIWRATERHVPRRVRQHREASTATKSQRPSKASRGHALAAPGSQPTKTRRLQESLPRCRIEPPITPSTRNGRDRMPV